MKKIIIYFGLISILCMSSCSDSFLEVTPTTQNTESDYYSNEANLQKALVAAYDPLKWCDYAWGQFSGLPFLSDAMSDDIYIGGGDYSDIDVLHLMADFKATPEKTLSDIWVVMYSGVNRSNIAINKAEELDGLDEKVKAKIVAEAKTLRAFYYSWLWKLWGNIPYYVVNPNSFVPQIQADEVYKHILEDLDAAIASDALPMRATSTTYGRVTQAMAMMLRTKVVLYKNDESRYTQCLSDMKAIIASGQYGLLNNFADLWEEVTEWSSETIWDINNFSVNGSKSWDNAIAAGGTVYPQLIGINGLVGSPDFEGGWGGEPVRKEIYDLYSDNDQRKDIGILNFVKYHEQTGATYSPRFEDTGYFLRKYLPRKGGNTGSTGSSDMNFNNNVRVFRYSETLLNAAELTLRTNGTVADAQSYFDAVRNRAYKGSAPAVTVSLDLLLQERRLEFVGEGHRFWDLVRYGKAESVLGSRGYTANKKHIPIPSSEIDKAGGTLTQNPY